ncbi:MAG TPA: 2OG-Fe(II) oxygenase [Dongiaceae bacterium]|nr:2OG-Fe(II) oxygenase [Dongiaceae bacterium]
MSTARSVALGARLFPFEHWDTLVGQLSREYRENHPCPHILLKNFLDAESALAMSREFPEAGTEAWTQYKHANENKLGMPWRDLFPTTIGAVTDELNSDEFVAWVSELTGIPGLVADPMLEGGGLHQSGRGGYLNVHTDFSNHHFHSHWRRRVNLILYLNPEWEERWGGSIELWERAPGGGIARCAAKYPPLLNHALIFTTDEKSLHGFPDPLQCPEGQTRKSLALYYYTVEKATIPARSTDYFARPQDSRAKAAMIWLDKKAVDLYSRAKARFGFSDAFASRALGWLWRKK